MWLHVRAHSKVSRTYSRKRSRSSRTMSRICPTEAQRLRCVLAPDNSAKGVSQRRHLQECYFIENSKLRREEEERFSRGTWWDAKRERSPNQEYGKGVRSRDIPPKEQETTPPPSTLKLFGSGI
jgi:hypothetical protein